MSRAFIIEHGFAENIFSVSNENKNTSLATLSTDLSTFNLLINIIFLFKPSEF
jgi:hypothetical protein